MWFLVIDNYTGWPRDQSTWTDLNEKLPRGRRGIFPLEDMNVDGNERGGCTEGEAEAQDVGFEKYFFLPAIHGSDKEAWKS